MTALAPAGDEPPERFRIFRAGVNESDIGPVIFDEIAAKQTMAEYHRRGVDIMIDLEHRSVKDKDKLRADDSDARGSHKLRVIDGELWAEAVKWTTDGARRLKEKTQRYMSPVFFTDSNDRVCYLFNVAICGMPATHHTTPLVAASASLARHSYKNHAVRARAAIAVRKYTQR